MKKFFLPLNQPQGQKIFFHRITPKKKIAYILVKGLMANFKFQNFWPKKMDFFFMERPFYPVTPSNFDIFHHSWINQNGEKMGNVANHALWVAITL